LDGHTSNQIFPAKRPLVIFGAGKNPAVNFKSTLLAPFWFQINGVLMQKQHIFDQS